MAKVFGQPLIVRVVKVPVQQTVQLALQSPGGHRQSLWGNLSILVTISQPEALLQQRFDSHGELGSRRGDHLHHLAINAG